MNIKEKLTMINNKLTDILLNIMLVFVVLSFGVYSYWHLADYEVLTPHEGNYELDKTQYKKGETLLIHLRICKNIDLRERVYGRFIDGVIFSVPDMASNFDVKCYNDYLAGVKIPDTLPVGNYVYEEKIVYKVNPVKEITYTFTTPEFQVIE